MSWAALPLDFAETLLFWHAANYLVSADPIRSTSRKSYPRTAAKHVAWFLLRAAAAAALTLAVAGWWPGILLAATVLIGCVLLPVARWRWVPAGYIAEWELAVNIGFAVFAQFLMATFHMHIRWSLFRFPVSDALAAAYTTAAALLIFVVRGGTLIVRGVLDRAGTMPPPELPQPPGLPGHNPLDLERALPVEWIRSSSTTAA